MTKKPFLCTPFPTPPEQNRGNALPRLVQTVSEGTKRAYQQASEPVKEAVEKAKPGCLVSLTRTMLTLVMYICIIGAVPMLLSGAFVSVLEIGATAGFCFLIIKLIDHFQAKKEERIAGNASFQQAAARAEQAEQALLRELGIPQNCPVVDVLHFSYSGNGSAPVVEGTREGLPAYNTLTMHAFSDGRMLYLALLFEKYAFDISTLTSFRTVNTPISIEDWRKQAAPSDPRFQPYGITSLDEESGYRVGGYSVLTFNMADGPWDVYIPNYETPVFEQLLRRSAQ